MLLNACFPIDFDLLISKILAADALLRLFVFFKYCSVGKLSVELKTSCEISENVDLLENHELTDRKLDDIRFFRDTKLAFEEDDIFN